jgi:hypothetical protein
MLAFHKKFKAGPALLAATAFFLAGCEVGSSTKPKSPYRAPSSGNSSTSPAVTGIEVATPFSVQVYVKDKSGFGIANVVPTITASKSVTGSSGVTTGGCSSTDRKGLATCTLTAQLPGVYTVSVLTPVQTSSAATVTVSSYPRSLSFATQPSSTAVSSAVLAAQPIVNIKDKAGNVITTSTDVVTLSLTSATSTSGGTAALAGVLTETAVAGVANFAGNGLAIDLVGSYTLKASVTYAGAEITATSSAITISFGAANKLGFVTQPSLSTAANVAFATQPIVALQDVAGNTVTSNSSCVVTMTLRDGDVTDNLFGTLSKTMVSGLADFSGLNLRVNTTIGGDDYNLRATPTGVSCNGLTVADSSELTITLSGLPSMLSIAQAPGASPLNMVWPTQPVVRVLDPDGNLVSGDNTTAVTLTATAGPAGTIVGSTTISVVNGVATFTGLKTAGAAGDEGNYTIQFTGSHPGFASITPVSVVQAINTNGLTPSKLFFNVQPQNVAIRQPMQSIIVRTADSGNYFCFDDNTSTVRLAMISGPGKMYELGDDTSDNVVPNETPAKTAVNGLASFPGISFDTAGTYVIEARGSNGGALSPISSNTFAITNFTTANNLNFAVHPSDTGVSITSPWTTPPQVEIRDVYNNRVTSDNTTVVNLECVAPLGCTLLGTTSVTAVNGLANFTGTNVRLNVTAVTSDIVIKATATVTAPTPALNSTMSNNFTQQ